MPSTAYHDVVRELAPYVNRNTVIILNPGRTFGAIEFSEELKKNGVKEMPQIAETQTIIYTCRRSDKNCVTIFAMKKDVEIAALDRMYLNKCQYACKSILWLRKVLRIHRLQMWE